MNDNEHENNLRDVVRRCVTDQGKIALITQSINKNLRDYALSDKAALFPNTEEGIRKMLTPTQNNSLTEASYKTLRNKFLFANAIIAFANKYPDSRAILAQGGLEDCYRITKGNVPKSQQFAALALANRLVSAPQVTPQVTPQATPTKATPTKATAKPGKVKTGGPVSLTNDNLNSAAAVLNSAAGRELAEEPRQILLNAARILLSMRDAG